MKTASPKKTELGLEETPVQEKVVVPSKMTAAVLYGSEDLRIEKIDVPALAVDEVLLRVRLALTDGTDLKVWKRGYHAKMIQPPAVFGHEVVGEIVAMGKRVDPRWRLGTRVIAAIAGCAAAAAIAIRFAEKNRRRTGREYQKSSSPVRRLWPRAHGR